MILTWSAAPRPRLTISGTNIPSFFVGSANNMSFNATVIGPRGIQGPPGADAAQADPGDLTLLFDNGLI